MSIRFPEDEKDFPWLAMLMDAYEITDQAVLKVQEEDQKKRGLSAACRKGCNHCCSHMIPVTSVELSGLAWFVKFKMNPRIQRRVAQSISEFSGKPGCPLLLDGSCSVYPVRPLGVVSL